MKAMILAAGEGRRMQPLTLQTPKPLLTVHGKALIEHQIERIKRAGITDIIINVAYLGQQIQAHLGDGAKWSVSITYSDEGTPLETGGAIVFAKDLLGPAPFVLVNADVWTDFEFVHLSKQPLNADTLGHLVLVPNPNHHHTGDFAISEAGILQRGVHPAYTFSGVSVLNPKVFFQYPGLTGNFPLRDVLHWACDNQLLTGELYSGAWVDVGTPERLDALNARS